jgi:hypothetical protein
MRVKAEEDLRTLKAFEKLSSDLESQKVLAISDGLDALAKQFQSQLGEKKDYTFTVGKNSSIFRSGTSETDPVHSKQVTDAVFELSAAIDPLTPMASVNNVLRTLAIAVPKQLSAVFVQITALAPVTQDDVRKYSATEYMRRLTSLELKDLTPDGKSAKGSEPYSLAGLKSRLNYRNVRAEDDKSTDTEADEEKATN